MRASPKSQIFRSQVAFSSRLLGFRSRCSTLAECTYFSPRRICAAASHVTAGAQVLRHLL